MKRVKTNTFKSKNKDYLLWSLTMTETSQIYQRHRNRFPCVPAFIVLTRISVTARALSVYCCLSVTVIYKPQQYIHPTCTHFTLLSLQTYQLCQCWSMAALSIWLVQRAVLSKPARETYKCRIDICSNCMLIYDKKEKKNSNV